jgi:hypothetical protein
MTVYREDPHDSWYAALTVGVHDHTGRAQFWLAILPALALFWSAVAWAVWTIL